MSDYLIRATAANAQIRAFAVSTRDLTEFARCAHNTSPVMTAALGRLLSGALLMGAMLKNGKDTVTIQLSGDGPAKGLTATADGDGHVNGYVMNPDVMLPPNEKGKLDVGGAIGKGVIRVIRDMGLKEPYIGTCELQTGEIAEDLTYYFASSEQVPSSVGLGVLMNRDNTVNCAGGFIIQLMPFIDDDTVDLLEQKLASSPSVTSVLSEGKTCEDLLSMLLGALGLEITDRREVSFRCGCDRDRVSKALVSIGKEELKNLIAEDRTMEIKCHVCGKAYDYTTEELKELLRKSGSK